MSPHVFQLERWLILLLWSFNAIFSVLLCRLHSPELTDPLRSHWWTIWVWNTHTHTRGIKEKYSCHWLLQSPVLCWSRHRGATFLFTTVSYSWVKEAISFVCGLNSSWQAMNSTFFLTLLYWLLRCRLLSNAVVRLTPHCSK